MAETSPGTTPALSAGSIPSGQSAQGAIFTPAYVERVVRVFAIQEGEVDSIALANTLSTVFFSIFSGLATLALSIWVNASFYSSTAMPPAAEVLCKFGAPICVALSLVFLALGFWIRRRRSSTWERIQKESKAVQPPV